MRSTPQAVALVALLWSCAGGREAGGNAPAVNVLVMAGDSTFWLSSDSGAFRVRRSEILLARVGRRFYEVYVTEDDRSFYDAVIVGQRVYRRDIVSGDSTVVHEDAHVAALASSYASAHPDQRPLATDEDEAENPSLVSTTETEIVDVIGPFVTFETHVDRDMASGREVHETRRSVIDLRASRVVSLHALLPDSALRRVLREGRRAVAAAFDSVRRSSDERARFATRFLNDFTFDATSFSLVESNGEPAIAFLIPGRGRRAGGYALPLPPIAIPADDSWNEVRSMLPTESTTAADVWRGGGAGTQYDLVARYDSTTATASLVVRDHQAREWRVTNVPAPVQRVIRLDAPSVDTITLHALTRAFDEAASFSGDLRTTMNDHRSSRLLRVTQGDPLHYRD